MKLKMSTRMLGGFGIMTTMVLVGGLAGIYGVSQLDETLDFITVDAWEAAEGASEGSIGIYQEMLAVEGILLEPGNVHEAEGGVQLHSFDAAKGGHGDAARDGVESEMGKGPEHSESGHVGDPHDRLIAAHFQGQRAVTRMLNSKVMDAKVAGDYKVLRDIYEAAQDKLVTAQSAFAPLDSRLSEQFDVLRVLLEGAATLADAEMDQYENKPNRKISWNSGFGGNWTTADDVKNASIQMFARNYYYRRLLTRTNEQRNVQAIDTISNDLISFGEKVEGSTFFKRAQIGDVLVQLEHQREADEKASGGEAAMQGSETAMHGDGAAMQGGETAMHGGESAANGGKKVAYSSETSYATAMAHELEKQSEIMEQAVNAFLAVSKTKVVYDAAAHDILEHMELVVAAGEAAIEGQDELIEDTKAAAYYLIAATLAVSLLLALVLSQTLTGTIRKAFAKIVDVCNQVADGELKEIEVEASGDEVEETLVAMKNMVGKLETENVNLNDSVIDLLEAVSNMSDRDLTVKVPVAADVTGPVADAMNMMASEIARVLGDIREIAQQVAEAATLVQEQGGKVTSLAASERRIVEDTMVKLDHASKSMSQVAKLAIACNETAAKASLSTQDALETVTKTANGMNDIRETIAETEKRIKRLGERSQEINGVVEIINNIAERTHVLALNASMQAAAAGDAGRGFAVVADEVQRLAESSRQSTSEIAGLVRNIQAETAETMATMNRSIAQVVEGTELAQAAGGQMEATQKTTSELANAVEQIARQSLAQSKVSDSLRDQAAQVQTSTEETSVELEQQSSQTANLVDYSRRLVDSVNVFKLPEAS